MMDSAWCQSGGRALRPLWQVLTRISGIELRTIVADWAHHWAEEQVCQRPGVERKSAGSPLSDA
jgi:hypothetical protein